MAKKKKYDPSAYVPLSDEENNIFFVGGDDDDDSPLKYNKRDAAEKRRIARERAEEKRKAKKAKSETPQKMKESKSQKTDNDKEKLRLEKQRKKETAKEIKKRDEKEAELRRRAAMREKAREKARELAEKEAFEREEAEEKARIKAEKAKAKADKKSKKLQKDEAFEAVDTKTDVKAEMPKAESKAHSQKVEDIDNKAENPIFNQNSENDKKAQKEKVKAEALAQKEEALKAKAEAEAERLTKKEAAEKEKEERRAALKEAKEKAKSDQKHEREMRRRAFIEAEEKRRAEREAEQEEKSEKAEKSAEDLFGLNEVKAEKTAADIEKEKEQAEIQRATEAELALRKAALEAKEIKKREKLRRKEEKKAAYLPEADREEVEEFFGDTSGESERFDLFKANDEKLEEPVGSEAKTDNEAEKEADRQRREAEFVKNYLAEEKKKREAARLEKRKQRLIKKGKIPKELLNKEEIENTDSKPIKQQSVKEIIAEAEKIENDPEGSYDGDITEVALKNAKKRLKKAKKDMQRAHSEKPVNVPRWAAPFGAAVLVLAIVGVCTIGYFGYKLVQPKPVDKKEAAILAQVVDPIVRFDPDSFDDISKLDDKFVLMVSVYYALENKDLTADNAYDTESGKICIYDNEVEDAEKEIFGGADVDFETIQITGTTFEYDELQNCFVVGASYELGYYKPKVTKIDKSGTTTTVEVSYLDIDSGDSTGKTAEYVLSENRNGYKIISMEVTSEASSGITVKDEE